MRISRLRSCPCTPASAAAKQPLQQKSQSLQPARVNPAVGCARRESDGKLSEVSTAAPHLQRAALQQVGAVLRLPQLPEPDLELLLRNAHNGCDLNILCSLRC